MHSLDLRLSKAKATVKRRDERQLHLKLVPDTGKFLA